MEQGERKTTDNNLNALQTLVNTMDYITSVAPIMQAGDTIGYTINFYQSNPLSIYNGTTSQIGITQDEEGNWLWTLDGEVLTTPEGTPIPANGQDAAAPQLSTGKALQDEGIKTDAQGNAITADIAYLSVDGGVTKASKATKETPAPGAPQAPMATASLRTWR